MPTRARNSAVIAAAILVGIPAGAHEVFEPEAEMALGSPIETYEMQGGGGDPLTNEAVRAVLSDLGGGDPVLGYQQAVVSVGVTIAAEGEAPTYDIQVIVPGQVTHDFAPAPAPTDDPPWLSPGVHDQVTSPDEGDVVIHVRVKRALLESMPHRFVIEDNAKLRGEDPQAAAEAWFAQRSVRGTEAVTALTELIESAQGVVLGSDLRMGEVVASVPGAALGELATDTRLAAIELETESNNVADDNAAGYWLNVFGLDIDGIEVESLLQSTQFYEGGFHGQGEQLGLTEEHGDDIRRNHPGFDDASGNDRVQNRKWNAFYWTNPDPSMAAQHPTATATVMVGDITLGQDAGVTSTWERRRRSGTARRASLLGMTTDSRSRLVGQMTDPSRDIRVVNMSAGQPQSVDPQCEGRDNWSRTANELFESGVVLVKSAGNTENGQSPPTNCRVTSPGSAIGTFTVGAYQPLEDGTGTLIHPLSNRGGTASEGRGRTVIAMAAPTKFQYPYLRRDDCSFDYGAQWGTNPGSCPSPPGRNYDRTSGAAPMVSGSAALVHSHYRTVFGALSPGPIHTLLLLMGDRRNENGAFMTFGYDGVWGAGRLRLRRVDGAGLDGPARWTLGSRCVAHGQSLIIPVTTSDVTSDVDVMKAVAYLYDSRHDDTGSVDNDRVALSLMRETSPGVWSVVVSDNSTDNKKRVFVYNPTPGRYAVRLTGTAVSASGEGGCGTNEMRVWYSYMHEDSDREPAENLDTVRPEDEDVP